MNAIEREALWERLAEAELVVGEGPPTPDGGDTPWYVRAMLGIAGWLAAVFGLALVGSVMSALIGTPTGVTLLVVGALFCTGAWALYRAAPASDFLAQFAFVTSLAGQGLLAVGIGTSIDLPRDVTALFCALAALELVLVVLVPNALHRVWCTLAATTFAAFALFSAGLGPVTAPLVAAGFAVTCLGEAHRTRGHAPLQSVGSALGLALAVVTLVPNLPAELVGLFAPGGTSIPYRTESVGLGLVTGAIAWYLSRGLDARTATRLSIVAAGIALAVAMRDAPGHHRRPDRRRRRLRPFTPRSRQPRPRRAAPLPRALLPLARADAAREVVDPDRERCGADRDRPRRLPPPSRTEPCRRTRKRQRQRR